MLKIIKEYSPNKIKINLAGSFNENNEIIKQYHGINNINFLGFVTHDILAQKYQDADLFVFPTLGEGYGMVVLEAFLYRTLQEEMMQLKTTKTDLYMKQLPKHLLKAH